MPNQSGAVDEAAIERLVSQIRGVMAVRVVRDAHGQIDELHVVASPERSAKQMVRDVESILFVRGGIRIDHRKISLVQISESSIQPSPIRIQLLEITHVADPELIVTVTLGMGDQRVQGVGRNRPDQSEAPEYLAGYATVHALDQLVGPRGQLRLENIQRQAFGQLDTCMAHLSILTDDGIETLLGVSVMRGDELSTAARAVLDAVNRPLQRILSGMRAPTR